MEHVRSMIDEKNLSSNARQFMNDLQQMQQRKRIVDENSQQFQLAQLMMMMKGNELHRDENFQLSFICLGINPSGSTVPRYETNVFLSGIGHNFCVISMIEFQFC